MPMVLSAVMSYLYLTRRNGEPLEMEEDRRKAPRIKARKGGRIVYLNGAATRDCAIRNLSTSGARLVVESTAGLPDQFGLMFEDGSQRWCIVRWRRLAELGIEFGAMV